MEEIEPLLKRMKEIGDVHGKTQSQVALNWIMYSPVLYSISVSDFSAFIAEFVLMELIESGGSFYL
jgi:diketogulonate reductase-like aldo/keto reductase